MRHSPYETTCQLLQYGSVPQCWKIRSHDLTTEGANSVKLITAAILCVAMLTIPAFAQTRSAAPAPAQAATPAPAKSADTNMQILLEKVKADKKLLVAANMSLTDAEGKTFWPIYEMYQTELKALNDRLITALKSYADGYSKNTLTDAQATKLANDILTIEQDEVAMRKKYATSIAAVLPGKKAARYIQIETKIRAALRSEMADVIPLVP
jgi:hypothetical protein